jgi:hypothetical protein
MLLLIVFTCMYIVVIVKSYKGGVSGKRQFLITLQETYGSVFSRPRGWVCVRVVYQGIS